MLLGPNPVDTFTFIQLKRTTFGQYAPFPLVVFPFNDIDKQTESNDWKTITQMLGHE